MPQVPHLTRAHVEQLRSIVEHGLTWPGDLISKAHTKDLRKWGLVSRIEGWVCATVDGEAAIEEADRRGEES